MSQEINHQNLWSCNHIDYQSKIKTISRNRFYSITNTNSPPKLQRSSSRNKTFNDRLLPQKVSSQQYRIINTEPESPHNQGPTQETHQDLDLNEQLRIENAMLKYSNLLKLNILEDQNYYTPEQEFSLDFQYDEPSFKLVQTRERSKSKDNGVFKYQKNNFGRINSYKPYIFANLDNLSVPGVNQKIRKISKAPFKILDAPKLKDDFYYQLLDWSSGNQIAIGLDNQVYTWNAKTNEATKLMEVLSTTKISSVSWSGRGEILAVGDDSGFVRIYDVEKSKLIRTYNNHLERVGSLDWNGFMITSGSKDKNIIFNDIRQHHSPCVKFQSHKQEVCGLKWSPSEQLLASGGNDNVVQIHSIKMPSSAQCTFKDHIAAVKALAWSPHQTNYLCTGGGTTDKKLKFWNVSTQTCLQSVDTGSQICNMKWSVNTDELVTTHGFSLNQIAVWEVGKLQRIATLYGHSYRVLYLAMSPDGENIVTGSGDETLRFWKVFPPRKKSSSIGTSQSVLDANQFELR